MKVNVDDSARVVIRSSQDMAKPANTAQNDGALDAWVAGLPEELLIGRKSDKCTTFMMRGLDEGLAHEGRRRSKIVAS